MASWNLYFGNAIISEWRLSVPLLTYYIYINLVVYHHWLQEVSAVAFSLSVSCQQLQKGELAV